MIGRPDHTTDPDLQRLALGLAATRTLIGLAMAGRPTLLGRFLGVDATTADRTRWSSAMVAGREVALGVGTLTAATRGGDVLPWFVAQALADTGDGLAMLGALRRRHVWRTTGTLVLLAAAGGAAAGAYGAVRARR